MDGCQDIIVVVDRTTTMVSYAAQVGLLRRARPFKEIEVSSVDGFQAGAVIGIGSIRIEGAAAPLGPVAVAPAPPARVCGRERRKSGGREGSRSPPPPSSISADSRDNTPLPPRRRSRRTTLRATTARHIRPPRCASELCSERRHRSTPLSPSPTNHHISGDGAVRAALFGRRRNFSPMALLLSSLLPCDVL
jgi:hypothetical protein